MPSRAQAEVSILEILRSTLWLGLVGFGGGVSVLGLIGHLAVERRRWLTEREFTNTATIAQMLPGGAAANALAHIGLRLRGLPGAIAAYTGFILPGALMILALAWAYVRFGVAPSAEVVLSGLNAAVVGIVAALTLRMVRAGVGRLWQMGVAFAALLLSLEGGAGSGEIALLGVFAGLVVDLLQKRARLARLRRAPRAPSPPVALPDEGEPLKRLGAERDDDPPSLPAAWPVGLVGQVGAGSLLALGLLFFRTGLGAYGGGFAIVPSLHAAAVTGGWISERQFASAVAVGKLTPGPVLLMATFIGYVAHGLAGALVATFTIFAAPFGLVVSLGSWLLRMRSRRVVRAALRGLTPAVVGLMAAAAVTLGTSMRGPADVAVSVVTLLTLSRFATNPVAVLLVAGVARYLLSLGGV
ncbi:MAG TPA: chromate efflux transporter [Anaeromyxobacteraceae bacterium]|nr:chromate efflux transporter [Anaeromyxobacteraceae bacterium]